MNKDQLAPLLLFYSAKNQKMVTLDEYIKAMADDAAFYLTDDTEQLLTQYAKLDDYGRHTVASVMQVEYERCSKLNNLDD